MSSKACKKYFFPHTTIAFFSRCALKCLALFIERIVDKLSSTNFEGTYKIIIIEALRRDMKGSFEFLL